MEGVNFMGITFAKWTIQRETGYEPKTTFYEDFGIAENFGLKAIEDTYKSAIKNAKSMGYEEQTELYMVLNWKIWEWFTRYEHTIEEEAQISYKIAKLYDMLWHKYFNEEIAKDFKKNKTKWSYFYKITD